MYVLTALWSGSYALQISGTNLATVLFWAAVQSIAYSINPVLWLIMAFQFIERDSWVTKRNIMLLLVIPILSVIIAWSNGMHGLMWQNVYLDTGGAYPVMAKTYGAWFWFIAAYSYGLNIISELMLALSLRRKISFVPRTGAGFVYRPGFAFLPKCFLYFWYKRLYGYDLTSVTAGVSGLIIAWGIFYYRLFDIVPVARENIIEKYG
jgi:hypothetical protein